MMPTTSSGSTRTSRPENNENQNWQLCLANGILHAPRGTTAPLRPDLNLGILELDNNTAERAMRAVVPGRRSYSRKSYIFVGSQTDGKSAATAYSLIETAQLNGVDPQAWIAETCMN